MPLTIKPMRYAHPEGHTDVCYFDGEKSGLITCGGDGDVRFWIDLMDDDPSAVCVAEQATACVSKNSKIYVGNDNNTVQVLTHPNLDREGIVTRFSATVSALATARKSNLIVSGACDMRIQVTNIESTDSIELNGHEAPILGLTLDPREEFVASSSADGSVKVWSIKEKKSVHSWSNVVPKCNSFFTAKAHCAPSFNAKDGSYLAYPHQKDLVLVERNSWKEITRLKCPALKGELNICKSSECGSRIAACSIVGEIVVWNVENSSVVGYVEHHQSAKITAISWHLKKTSELAFCDSLGQLGCVEVSGDDDDSVSVAAKDNHDPDDDIYNDLGLDNNDDDDDENVISLNRIKATADDDQKSVSSVSSAKPSKAVAEVNMQDPFQPGSTPVHLLSRFMVWNDVGIVRCYTSEDNEESSIEVEFHDTSVHHSMHMSNYFRHTIAALSCEALAMSCPAADGSPSKLVVIALQGWGSGNKEWTADLPEDEESLCVAAGSTFVALATTRGNLRLFMVSGIQREVLALPGPVVAMNAVGNHLVIAYHKSAGFKDQYMSLLWIQICGADLKSRTLNLPLAPGSELMWLGLSDAASPVVMDADGVIKIFNRRSNLWRVAADTDKYPKGKMDHYFIVGVSEREKLVRCILCKGSHYPATTPRPNVVEVDLKVPLCDMDSEKTRKEAAVWQIGRNPSDEATALFTLIGFVCTANAEFRVVDLCQNIADLDIIELAIKFASKTGKMALANKLQGIAEEKNRKKMAAEAGKIVDEEEDIFAGMDDIGGKDTQDDIILTPIAKPTQEIEIRPLTLSLKKRNPFLKKTNSPGVKGLDGLNSLPEKISKTPVTVKTTTGRKGLGKKEANGEKKETFVKWFEKNKPDLQAEFPELSLSDLTKTALKRYKEDSDDSQKSNGSDSDNKKRKLSSPDSDSQSKKSTGSLSSFLRDK
ncbi:WD repeat and HMG-box DNA-binding protein 1 [Microplitis mediator]|uniref:WD repeat and HMG-box DNA-binding protein 1 n=1 Tax=Microplitis mediator TaxID=375433 RepID=UPI00255416BB|nr:WD repeat and HMG-box DNA-binding protein 1 [Microplitis mediator]